MRRAVIVSDLEDQNVVIAHLVTAIMPKEIILQTEDAGKACLRICSGCKLLILHIILEFATLLKWAFLPCLVKMKTETQVHVLNSHGLCLIETHLFFHLTSIITINTIKKFIVSLQIGMCCELGICCHLECFNK